MADRYHRAAQDGNLDILREATKRDCNLKDEDGMTPTLWASFEGNVDALKLLVVRGGEPERSDNYGNTALHLASARGHMNCIVYLINLGVNMFCLDIDSHTPQELAAMNDCNDILLYLDDIASKQESEDPKKVKKLVEAAEKDHEKLLKNFKKVQKKADKMSSKKEKQLEDQRKKLEVNHEDPEASENNNNNSNKPIVSGSVHMPFSEMVGVNGKHETGSRGLGGSTVNKRLMGTVFKKTAKGKTTTSKNMSLYDDGFKVSDVAEDGTKTVRNLNGLRRDSEVIFVRPDNKTRKNLNEEGDTELGGVGLEKIFEQGYAGSGASLGSGSSSTLGSGSRLTERRNTSGILSREGFGEIAFRRPSMAATLFAIQKDDSIGNDDDKVDSLGEVDEREEAEEEEESNVEVRDQVDLLLVSLGLKQYVKTFRKAKIDMESFVELSESDLKEMKVEMGPRKKILKAIQERKRDLAEAAEEDSVIQDSQL